MTLALPRARVYGQIDDHIAGPSVTSRLGVDASQRFWTVDGQPWFYCAFSSFALLARYAKGDDIRPVLAAYKGFNTVRVFPYVPRADWGALGWDWPDFGVALTFVRQLGAWGWRVKFDALTDDDPRNIDVARRFIAVLAGEPNVLWAAGNEPRTHKAINVDALRGPLAATGQPYSCGRFEDEATYWGSYGLDHPRDDDQQWFRRSHSLMEWFDGSGPETPHQPYRYPWIVDENVRPDATDVHSPDDYAAFAGGCALFGAGCTMHTQSGKWALLPGQFPPGVSGNPNESAYVAGFLVGARAFPAGACLGAYVHDTADEQRTGSLRTYRVGPYGVRCRPTDGSPVLIGV